VKRDLENLKKLAEIKRRIIVTKDADYRYRIVVLQAEVFMALTSSPAPSITPTSSR